MRQVPRQALVLIGAGLTAFSLSGVLAAQARAEDRYYLNQSQSGFNLPGVSLPQGQDEVRAADGTTCRSAVGGSGAYLDVGAINGNGSGNEYDNGNVATYGRVVIPLSRGGKRLNCTELYDLEIARLRAELKLLQMGLSSGPLEMVSSTNARAPSGEASGNGANWANEGWSDGKPKRK
ncbi:hypothetical protein [Aureimonas phyllosphaerae]|uniref:Uncharacterized protein n=1 Tax=Aureimonas phyllosphaerae TaxID=1166078 RepID=A0A7W6BS85_9HYPH|nr:hypothetical protein [Aureimonas phyllosphaerae]MBB3937103.1 hypothetical protein [Aureimonas phyllosphaerae]MBB3960782.1 hypothetical protein [Aureimonas phyllosphaerae]SFF50234.1 hypothetical protein SAMN05216566_11873 [Aureimonas phyllosphaerae]